MSTALKFALGAALGFVVGAAFMLYLAQIASGHWVSLSYVSRSENIRMDGGEAAASENWDELDRDFSAILKLRGTRGEPWVWYMPLAAWLDVDYTRGPGSSYGQADLAIAAYAAARKGDASRAFYLYGELDKIHPGVARETWQGYARIKLNMFKISADAIRRGKRPPGIDEDTVILEAKDAKLEVSVSNLQGERRLHISGLAFHSALAAKYLEQEQEGSVLRLKVILVLIRPGMSGSFDYTVALPASITSVTFGKGETEIWKKS